MLLRAGENHLRRRQLGQSESFPLFPFCSLVLLLMFGRRMVNVVPPSPCVQYPSARLLGPFYKFLRYLIGFQQRIIKRKEFFRKRISLFDRNRFPSVPKADDLGEACIPAAERLQFYPVKSRILQHPLQSEWSISILHPGGLSGETKGMAR